MLYPLENINYCDSEISSRNDSISNIDAYRKSYNDAIQTRSELSKNEKDMSKLKDEKAQRARFNQVDGRSPRRDVKKIIKETKNINNSNNN